MKKTLFALALAAALPLSLQAAERSYTYVEGAYVRASEDANGFGLRGSVAFADTGFYGLASYANIDVDFLGDTIDTDQFEIGAGYALNLSDRADLITELAYRRVGAEFRGVSSDADGYRLSVGSRFSFTDNFEGIAKANYLDSGDLGDDVSGTFGLLAKFSETWAVTGEVELDGDDESYLIGLRAHF